MFSPIEISEKYKVLLLWQMFIPLVLIKISKKYSDFVLIKDYWDNFEQILKPLVFGILEKKVENWESGDVHHDKLSPPPLISQKEPM